jgi:ferrous iron transport protein B
MARAAFVVDRFMRMIGLPGKSFVPMIVGFGCNVPAIMATRTLESRRDRILTNIMNPFMSCGARLPVYALFAAAFFPVGGQNLVFFLYVLGIAVAIMTGLIMRHTLFKGDSMPFIMELPNYHLPTIQSIAIRTWDRLQTFLLNAGKVIIPMAPNNLCCKLNTSGSCSTPSNASCVYKASKVPTTASFARIPVKIPTVAGQFSSRIPIGLNTGTKVRPISLNTDFCVFSLPKLPSMPREFKKFSTNTIGIITYSTRNGD